MEQLMVETSSIWAWMCWNSLMRYEHIDEHIEKKKCVEKQMKESG